MDDGFTPGWGGDCCCEMEGCACDSCAMGGARESCDAWREHYYWNHTSDDKQFLVVASGDFRHSLRIPPEIGSHLRYMIPESDRVKLEAPNGRVYPVEVSRDLGVIVLRSGWNKFVDAHHIEEDDSILFVCRGNSCFKVNVFNSVGHEKSLSCSPLPSGISEPVPPFSPSNHHVQNEQVVPNPGRVNSADFDYDMLPGCRLTTAQDEKVREMAHTSMSEIPLYVAVMSRSNVSLKNCYVYIPLGLVEHFKDVIKLEAPDNNIYSVGASKHGHEKIVLESGWHAFVASLHIQENDILIFRSKEKTRLEVRILDPSGLEKTSSSFVKENPSGAHEMCDDTVQIVDPPPPQVFDLSNSDEDNIMREGTRESCRAQKRVTRSCAKTRKMASTSSPSTKSGYGAHKPHDQASENLGVGLEPFPNNLGGPSQRRYIFAQRATLPLQVEMKVEEKVQAIRSELPIFVRVMTPTNVDWIGRNPCIMVFCMEYASACLPDKTQPLLLQLEGKRKLWHATLTIATSQKQRRVYLGWKEFVEGNQLKAGDICLFQLAGSNTGSLKMTVHLIRKSEAQM